MATELRCSWCDDVIEPLPLRASGRRTRSDIRRCADCRRQRGARGHGISVKALARRDGAICQLCGDPVDMSLRAPHPLSASVDRITPRAVGGSNDSANSQLAHRLCNQRKNAGSIARLAPRSSFYHQRRWRRLSARFRAEHPACATCGAATWCVDHIVAIEDGCDPWDETNMQALCRPCHLDKSHREYRSRCTALGGVSSL